MAWHYNKYQKEQSESDRLLYSDAEDEAREAKRGLWQDPYAVAPWEYRAARRKWEIFGSMVLGPPLTPKQVDLYKI